MDVYENYTKRKSNNDWVQLRLFPTAEVNNHWKLKARMTAGYDMKEDNTGTFEMTYGFAEGTYNKFKLSIGKMPFYSNVDDGLVMDDFFSGARIEIGSKFKLNLEAGRWNMINKNDYISANVGSDGAASYQGVELSYDDGSRFMIGGSYKHFNSDAFKNAIRYNVIGKEQENADIWSTAISYKFDKNVKIFYAYAHNTTADECTTAWTGQLNYKGSNKRKNSWGSWIAYRYVGCNVALAPTYDTFNDINNKKGTEVGVDWSPLDNTLLSIQYFKGMDFEVDKHTRVLFTRASWFF